MKAMRAEGVSVKGARPYHGPNGRIIPSFFFYRPCLFADKLGMGSPTLERGAHGPVSALVVCCRAKWC